MEYIETLNFYRSEDLVRFVNNGPIRVVSITQNDLGFVLFFKKILK